MNIACLLLSNFKLILLHFWLDSEKVECKWNRFRKNETEWRKDHEIKKFILGIFRLRELFVVLKQIQEGI